MKSAAAGLRQARICDQQALFPRVLGVSLPILCLNQMLIVVHQLSPFSLDSYQHKAKKTAGELI